MYPEKENSVINLSTVLFFLKEEIHFVIKAPHANVNVRMDIFAYLFTFVVVSTLCHIFIFSHGIIDDKEYSGKVQLPISFYKSTITKI